MKPLKLTLFLLALGALNVRADTTPTTAGSASQTQLPAPTEYQIINRGANNNVWQRETYERGPNGQIITHEHQYTELANGLNYQNAQGQWVASKEEIDILPQGGAAAMQGRHQVYFPGDIYNGTIQLLTPDGKTLKSRPLGISYDDGNNTVFIGVLTNSIGYLVAPNQIIYPNAFAGLNADLRYTYSKGGFEQDVILHEQPPTPENLGLNAATTRLQILTEFFDPPLPSLNPGQMPQSGAASLADEALDFGAMKMVPGKAFLVNPAESPLEQNHWVAKKWVTITNRQFLVEETLLASLGDELTTLPASAALKASGFKYVVSRKRQLPQWQTTLKTDPARITVAQNGKTENGLVLDYNTIVADQDNFTFQGDTTYYINGGYNLFDTTTMEGGTVIKFNPTNSAAGLNAYGYLNIKTAPYRPAVITSRDDNSVGETISGSTGSPSTFANGGWGLMYFAYYYGPTNSGPLNLHDFNIRYLYYGVGTINWSSNIITNVVSDCQFGSVFYPITLNGIVTNILNCYNVLINNANIAFFDYNHQTVNAVNSTLHNCNFVHFSYPLSALTTLTNCLLVCVTNGDAWGDTINYGNSVNLASDVGVFQTVGGGSFYLATNSPYRNGGTTNIDPAVRADIATRTTYPPIVYSNTTITSPTTFNPQAQRDNIGNPDLGYHYDPLDYVFGNSVAESNVTFNVGTAVGWFYNSSGGTYGLAMGDSATATFIGTVTSPCHWSKTDTVQEGNGNWTASSYLGGIIGQSYSYAAPAINAKFTLCSLLAGAGNIFRDNYTLLNIYAQNCEFYGAVGGYYASDNFTNCLFVRGAPGLWWNYGAANMTLQNCTLIGGSFFADHTSGSTWPVTILDCAFDGTLIYMNAHGLSTSGAYCDYNSFLLNSNRTVIEGTHDLTITNSYYWQSSWFGNYYLTNTSPLINAGNTTADQVGLYHFTTQTNQVPETNSIVDIGYHYVATDAYGNPLDTNGDGIPDYLEDANGDGIFDSGDLGEWQISPYGLGGINQLQVFTPLKN